jgi:3-oxoacyl-[acyl-carrier-protein] synthase III
MHLGDGGGAAIVSAGDLKCEFLGYHMETYAVTPRTTGTLNGDYGPIRMPANRNLCFQAEMDDDYGAYLIPYDPELRRIADAETFLTDTLSRAAAKAGLALSDIDHIITAHTGDLQQTWQDDLTRTGIALGVFKNLQQETGNTACATPLIDIAAYAKDGSFRTGDTIAVWIPCTGVQVATILLKWL